MYYAERGEKSVIISGTERTRSLSSCFVHLWASSTRASSPLTVLTFHHRRSRGQQQESASAARTKTISSKCSPSMERSACVPKVNTLCIPGKHTGHTTGDLLHFNCTSWDEEIKQNRFFFLKGQKAESSREEQHVAKSFNSHRTSIVNENSLGRGWSGWHLMQRSPFHCSIASLVLAFVRLGWAFTLLRLVTHLRRRWSNDVVHGGTDISLVLHLD